MQILAFRIFLYKSIRDSYDFPSYIKTISCGEWGLPMTTNYPYNGIQEKPQMYATVIQTTY